MARGGIDLTQLALFGAGFYLFTRPQVQSAVFGLLNRGTTATPAPSTGGSTGTSGGGLLSGIGSLLGVGGTTGTGTTGNPGHPSGSTGSGDNPTSTPAAGADTSMYQGYKVDLKPANVAYVLVQNTRDGTWRALSSPAQYGQYGIVETASSSNLTYVPFGSQPAFSVKVNQPAEVATAFLRSDNPGGGGLTSTWPDIPDAGAAVAGLRAGYQSGAIVANGAFGFAVLHYYGIV